MIFIIIPIVAMTFFFLLVWQHTTVYCNEDLNGTADRILKAMKKCIDDCWSRHDFGSDMSMDDCYIVNLWIQDQPIINSDIEGLNENVKIYWEDQLNIKTEYTVKIRYNYTGNEISLLKMK
jgi:hypothetical protein